MWRLATCVRTSLHGRDGIASKPHLLDTSLSAGTATSMSTRAKLGLGAAGPCSAGAAPFLAGAFFFFGCGYKYQSTRKKAWG